MAKVPGLVRRGNSYSYRRRVPSELVTAYGRREVKISLKTRDYDEAAKLARVKSVELDADFDAIREEAHSQQPATLAVTTTPVALSSSGIQRLSDAHYRTFVENEAPKRYEILQRAHMVVAASEHGHSEKLPCFGWVNTTLANIKNSITGTYVSGGYAPYFHGHR